MMILKQMDIKYLWIILGFMILIDGYNKYGFSGDKRMEPAAVNFIIIFCDDLGYGDLGVFGHPTIRTPNLDRMAAEGQKWTSFYVAASVCTPSRAGLITGRLPVRSGMANSKRRVLFPDSNGGLPPEEITIAEILKQKNYATACIGKWHLGHLPRYLPTRQGFDYYFGIPYSNDMDRIAAKDINVYYPPRTEYWNVPILRNEEIIERPADQNTLTKRYTEQTVNFIKQHKGGPFFIYLAHNMPHVPLFRSEDFAGRSLRGLYGDVVEEIDWSVGKILQTLRQQGLAENTLVVFTSDNGPWLSHLEQGGSAGLLREGKGMTWEGGMREPTVFWWPGTIQPAVITEMGSTLDLLPTFAAISGASLPDGLILDGYDLQNVIRKQKKSPRDIMYFYRGTELYAVRKGPFKAHFITEFEYVKEKLRTVHDPPRLYNLDHDPSEKYDVADKFPEVIAEIQKLVAQHKATMVMGKDQLGGKTTD